MRTYDWAWIAWLLWFLGWELYALFTNPKNTFSDFIWTYDHSGFARFFVLAFTVWLCGHLTFGWWR